MITPSDAELVDAAAATYRTTSNPLIVDFGKSVAAFMTTRPDGLKIIAIEGTHDPLGWMLDFLALPILAHGIAKHPTLGILHAGFYAAAQAVLPKIALAVGDGPWVITGHSLGAALALLIGVLMDETDVAPVKIAAFAPPRVGGADFIAAVAGIPTVAYRYGDDPVTQVPFTIPPDYDYRQTPLIAIGGPMVPEYRCHNIDNYVAAVKARFDVV